VKISSLVQRCATSCTTHDNVARAAQLMWEHDIACLPVLDDQGHVAGTITDRDVCIAACTQSTPLRVIPVASVMAKPVFACGEGDEVDGVERTMSQHRIRRMPVIDDEGHPIGIVSLADIDILRDAQAGKSLSGEAATTPAMVSSPRPDLASAI
jgi:CBS domain-containing protein